MMTIVILVDLAIGLVILLRTYFLSLSTTSVGLCNYIVE